MACAPDCAIVIAPQVSASSGNRTIQSVELRIDAALVANDVITGTQPTAAVQASNADGGSCCMQA